MNNGINNNTNNNDTSNKINNINSINNTGVVNNITSNISDNNQNLNNTISNNPTSNSNMQTIPQLVDPTKMAGAIDNIHISSSPVNNPTAELKSVNASTISTGDSSSPRIVDTSIVKKDDGMPTVTINNAQPGSFKSKMDEAQKNYKQPSKFKSFMLVVFLIFLLAFIIFLPEVSSFMDGIFGGKNSDPLVSDPTTGVMECTYSESGMNLDVDYVRKFEYTDNKLNSVILETTTRGDINEDEKTLNSYNSSCLKLKKDVANLNGINISCDYSDGKLVRTENIDLQKYDSEKLESFYAEEGLELVSYQNGQDIDEIKTAMAQSGFSCIKKEK